MVDLGEGQCGGEHALLLVPGWDQTQITWHSFGLQMLSAAREEAVSKAGGVALLVLWVGPRGEEWE